MNIEKIYNDYKNKKIKCLCNNESGDLVEGFGTVCGYKESWLVLGFHTEYEGCIKEFTNSVKYSPRFKSYRFWNIKHLKEYNTDTSAGHPVKDDDIVRYSLETRRVKDKEP